MKVIARLSQKVQAVPGVQLFMQPAQDINVGGRLSRTLYQYTLQDADPAELNTWAPKMLQRMQALPQLRDVATDQQIAGTTATLTIDRDAAQRFGIEPQQIDDTLYDAFGQREVTQYFTQLNSYFVILEVPPQLEGDLATLRKLYVRAPNGQAVPLSVLVRTDTKPIAPLAVNHQSQFPSVTISFNLAPGASLGDAVTAINQIRDELHAPLSLQGSFQGSAQAFQTSLSTEPYLIAAALTAVYIILGVLYESYILPLTILSTLPSAGVGALLMLMLAHTDLSVIAMIGIILLIGIVKKNGIMMVDFAIHAERTRRHGAGRGHPPGLPAALSPDPDDDDGGAAVRPAADAGERRRLGTAQAARLRDGRWAAAEPGADALHDAGDLSLSRSAAAAAVAATPHDCRGWRRS